MATHTITKRNGETVTFQTELTVEQAAARLIRAMDRNLLPLQGFAFDLVQAWERHVLKGARFSEAQGLWLLKLASELETAPAAAQAGPFRPVVEALQRLQQGAKRQAVVRLQGVQVKAVTRGANAGGCFLFHGGEYAGKITPAGELRSVPTAVREVLEAAAADVVGAARAHGQATGSCSCCGRELSDPVSCWGGIGPICLERMAGADARRQLEAAFKATQLAAA